MDLPHYDDPVIKNTKLITIKKNHLEFEVRTPTPLSYCRRKRNEKKWSTKKAPKNVRQNLFGHCDTAVVCGYQQET